eukprot:366031-Chlamydomonas_euryale.AAC.13
MSAQGPGSRHRAATSQAPLLHVACRFPPAPLEASATAKAQPREHQPHNSGQSQSCKQHGLHQPQDYI